MTNEIDDDGEVPNTALVPVQPQTPAPAQTVAQARVDSVAKMLDAAYQRASMLELTDDEAERLLADFPDEDVRSGAKGNAGLLYIEHMSIRRRLLQVFGPGRWVPVCRRMWTEEYRTDKGVGIRVYTDVVLLIRGCYAGEAIGAGSYFPTNAQQDYSDAAEAAESEALRRICGKKLGIGLQVWNKAWCDEWKARRNAPRQEQPTKPRQNDKPAPLKKDHADSAPVLQRWIEVKAANLTSDGYPCSYDALLARVCSTVAGAGHQGTMEDWNDAALRAGTEALKTAINEIKAAGKVKSALSAEDFIALNAALKQAKRTWAEIGDFLNLPAGMTMTAMTREQFESVMAALEEEAQVPV